MIKSQNIFWVYLDNDAGKNISSILKSTNNFKKISFENFNVCFWLNIHLIFFYSSNENDINNIGTNIQFDFLPKYRAYKWMPVSRLSK